MGTRQGAIAVCALRQWDGFSGSGAPVLPGLGRPADAATAARHSRARDSRTVGSCRSRSCRARHASRQRSRLLRRAALIAVRAVIIANPLLITATPRRCARLEAPAGWPQPVGRTNYLGGRRRAKVLHHALSPSRWPSGTVFGTSPTSRSDSRRSSTFTVSPSFPSKRRSCVPVM